MFKSYNKVKEESIKKVDAVFDKWYYQNHEFSYDLFLIELAIVLPQIKFLRRDVRISAKESYSKAIKSGKYIIEPDSQNRNTIQKLASKSFSFYWDRLNKPYKRTLTHLRKTYATRERIYNNSTPSALHSNVKTTETHYIDNIEIAKHMVKQGFRVFPK